MDIRNPKYNRNGTIDCEINHPAYGWLPFTADPTDSEGEGRTRYAELIAGVHGDIAAASPTPITTLQDGKLEELNIKAQSFVDSLTSAYPEFEQLTFERQRAEALSWSADNTATTPNIDVLAANRGMDRVELLGRVVTKVTAYEGLAMAVAGQRQAFEDQIATATTEAELNAITITFLI